jgi:cysteine desulfurase
MEAETMIYLDNAATARTSPTALNKMYNYFTLYYGNPSAGYDLANESAMAIVEARETIASLLNVSPEEIFFTSGGTESDNWAIRGVYLANKAKGNHIITSVIEHPAVLRTCEFLGKYCGAEVTYLPVDGNGRVNPGDVESAITDRTVLVSIMTANNEIGTIQPIHEIAAVAHSHSILFHTDGVQAIGHMNIDAGDIDLLSASGHKFGGPKGTGFLYIKKGTDILPLLYGGGQEGGYRSGTENVPGIIGLGAAAGEFTDYEHLNRVVAEMKEKRDFVIKSILEEIYGAKLNGGTDDRLANNINVCIPGVNGDELMGVLSGHDICISTGSACSTSSGKPSHVLTAIGLTGEEARCSIRITLGHDTMLYELRTFINILKHAVKMLRGR